MEATGPDRRDAFRIDLLVDSATTSEAVMIAPCTDR